MRWNRTCFLDINYYKKSGSLQECECYSLLFYEIDKQNITSGLTKTTQSGVAKHCPLVTNTHAWHSTCN